MPGLPQSRRRRPAAHPGHRDVEEDEVDAALRDQREALGSGAGLPHGDALRLQDRPHQGAVGAVVVGHQDGAARPRIGPLRGRRRRGRDDRRGLGHGGQHQAQPRLRAAARGGRHGDLAAQQLRQQVGDGQPEPGPRRAPGGRGRAALEGLEDPREIRFRNARASVADREHRDLAPVAQVQRDGAGLRELDGVRQEVEQHLPQALLVGGDNRRQDLGPREPELQPGLPRLEADHVHQLVEEIGQPDLVAVDLEAPGLHARDVEEAVDQAGQVLGAAPDHP